MQKHVFFYIVPGGQACENAAILPADALASAHGLGDRKPFRFSFSPDDNCMHIQDESFRRRMSKGDKEAWDDVNRALFFLEFKFGARFLKRAFGDPQGSSAWRKLSQYGKVWASLSAFFEQERGRLPVDADVYEYVPEPDAALDVVGFDPTGASLGAGRPFIYVNRYANKAWKEAGKVSEDVDYDVLNEALYRFYLSNAGAIEGAFPGGPREDRRPDPEEFFACKLKGAVRIFKSQGHDEQEIRGRIKLGPADAVATFSFDPDKRHLSLRNMPQSFLAKRDGELLRGLLEKVSKSVGLAPHGLTVTFEAGLGRPFATKLGRCGALRGLVGEMPEGLADMGLLEVPLTPKDGLAALVSKPEEEDEKVPGLRRFRTTRGLPVKFPFVALCNRGASRGRRMRALLDEVAGAYPKVRDPLLILSGKDFVDGIRGKQRVAARAMASFLSDMGWDKRDVLDFLAGPDDLLKRAEYASLLREKRTVAASSRQADMGPGLGINDWWHIGLQEGLNRAEHTEDEPKKDKGKRPFNLTKRREKTAPYEVLLDAQRDKDQSAMKMTEQLLRESRI